MTQRSISATHELRFIIPNIPQDVLPKEKIKSLEKETKVKLKIKNASQSFKKKTTRRTKPKRHVSLSEDIDVVNIC